MRVRLIPGIAVMDCPANDGAQKGPEDSVLLLAAAGELPEPHQVLEVLLRRMDVQGRDAVQHDEIFPVWSTEQFLRNEPGLNVKVS